MVMGMIWVILTPLAVHNITMNPTILTVRGTAWYSLATRGLVVGGGVGGGVGSMVHCNGYSDC